MHTHTIYMYINDKKKCRFILFKLFKKKNTTKHLILIRLQGGKLIFRFRDFQFSDKGRYFNQKKETEC